jgi:hypothetical protein
MVKADIKIKDVKYLRIERVFCTLHIFLRKHYFTKTCKLEEFYIIKLSSGMPPIPARGQKLHRAGPGAPARRSSPDKNVVRQGGVGTPWRV